jgi:hypothetical protein
MIGERLVDLTSNYIGDRSYLLTYLFAEIV